MFKTVHPSCPNCGDEPFKYRQESVDEDHLICAACDKVTSKEAVAQRYKESLVAGLTQPGSPFKKG